MEQNIIRTLYEMWVDSKDYHEKSALENEEYGKSTGEVKKVIGEVAYHAVIDNITTLACEAEYAGFESGLRCGIMFISGIMKGGVEYAKLNNN